MSGRQFLAASLLSLAAAVPAYGQQIGVAVGDASTTAVAPGATISIPVVVDMSAAAGLDLASLSFNLNWDAARLSFVSNTPGSFGTVTTNETQTASGVLTAGVFSPTGTTSSFTALTLTLTAGVTEGATPITIQVTAAGDQPGQSIISSIVTTDLNLCVGNAGLYGDVTGDGAVNIIDAQQIARFSVGLSVADPDRMLTYGDVTADGATNIIDAQQVARVSVGLSTSGRTGDPVSGGCTDPPTGPGAIRVTTSTSGQSIPASHTARLYNESGVLKKIVELNPNDQVVIERDRNNLLLPPGIYFVHLTTADNCVAAPGNNTNEGVINVTLVDGQTSDAQFTISCTSTVLAPNLLSANASGDQITLTWSFDWPQRSLVSSQDRFTIEESTTSASSGFQTVYNYYCTNSTCLGQGSWTHNLTGKSPGTYYYRVRAYVGGVPSYGWTGYSQVRSVTITSTGSTVRLTNSSVYFVVSATFDGQEMIPDRNSWIAPGAQRDWQAIAGSYAYVVWTGFWDGSAMIPMYSTTGTVNAPAGTTGTVAIIDPSARKIMSWFNQSHRWTSGWFTCDGSYFFRGAIDFYDNGSYTLYEGANFNSGWNQVGSGTYVETGQRQPFVITLSVGGASGTLNEIGYRLLVNNGPPCWNTMGYFP